MGSRVTALLPRGGRSTLAGAGAAGSLLAAIVAAALITPGLIGFDDWSIAPSPGADGSLRVQVGTGAGGGGPAASATSAPAGLPAAPSPATPPGSDGPGAGNGGGDGRGPATGDGASPARPASPPGASSSASPAGDRPVALTESLARTSEGTGAVLGDQVDRLGTATGDTLSPVSPEVGGAARRGAAAGAERARRTGTAVGDAVRGLPGAAPMPKVTPLVRRVRR